MLLLGPSLSVAAGGQQQATEQGEESVELHVFHFRVSDRAAWDKLTAEYSRLNPNITFNVEIVGGGADWITALKTKFAGGRGPDIFVVDGPTQANLWGEYLTDLSDEPWVDDAIDMAKDPMTMDGKLMGMPFFVSGFGFIYNEDAMNRAGVGSVPSTFSELSTAAARLDDDGTNAFATGFGEWWVAGMQFANAPFAYREDPYGFMQRLADGEVSLADDALFNDWVDLIDLMMEHGESNQLTTDNNVQTSLFTNGDAAIMHQGIWKAPAIEEGLTDTSIGFMPVLLNDDADQMDRLPIGIPFWWIVNAESEHPEEAKEFLSWLVMSDYGRAMFETDFNMVPAYKDIDVSGLGPLAEDMQNYASQNKTVPWVFTSWPDGTYREFFSHVQAYVQGNLSREELLTEMENSYIRLSE